MRMYLPALLPLLLFYLTSSIPFSPTSNMSLSKPERPYKYMIREECFPQEVYNGFMDMFQDDKYVCKERLQPHKWSRIQVFLAFPNTETTCPKDANIKQQAKSYEIINNKLYRKPEGNYESRYSIPRNEVFDIIVREHIILIHPGRDKTFKEIQKKYHGIASKEVEWVVRHCRNCSQNRPASVRAPLTPIVANRVFERVQIDLIDFRHSPSDNYAWILHIKDHFSKFCMLFALHSKHAEPIAKCIAIFIEAFFPMEILQCDNGEEFKGALLILLRQYGIKIVHGAPRTPHVQGLVEQANGTIERKIGAWQADHGTSKWEPALTEIAWAMNRQYVESIGCAPYELVFRQKLRPLKQLIDDERKAELGVLTEKGGVITEVDIEAEVGGTTLGVTLGSPSTPDIPTLSEPKAQFGIPTLKTHQNDAISILDRPRQTASKNTPRESTKDKGSIFSQATKDKIFPSLARPPKPLPEDHVYASPANTILSIVSKETSLFGFSAGRKIAKAIKPPPTISWHFGGLLKDHILLFFEELDDHETMTPVPGGELGYGDDDGNYNIGQLIKGTLFHWPLKLVSIFKESTIPPDFEADLAPQVLLQELVASLLVFALFALN
jgi:hypothetical protein